MKHLLLSATLLATLLFSACDKTCDLPDSNFVGEWTMRETTEETPTGGSTETTVTDFTVSMKKEGTGKMGPLNGSSIYDFEWDIFDTNNKVNIITRRVELATGEVFYLHKAFEIILNDEDKLTWKKITKLTEYNPFTGMNSVVGKLVETREFTRK